MTIPELCDNAKCNRECSRKDGWGNFWCSGHGIIAEANADSHGKYGISAETYRQRVQQGVDWLNLNPNPPKETP